MLNLNAEDVRKFVRDWVEKNRRAAAVVNDSIFYFGELGMQEHRSTELMTTVLKDHGFAVEVGISGFPTGFLATYGSGSPVIALHAEFDGLPTGSQKPGVTKQEWMTDGAPGHMEGHNSNGAVLVTAALALRYAMEKYGIAGTIKVFGAPAEEQVISRPYFVRDGYFDDVDVAVHNHIMDTFSTKYGVIQSAIVAAKFTFLGETGHAAIGPWKARDALDAAVLMDIGLAQYREHMEPGGCMSRVINYGGDQSNVIPAKSVISWNFRGPTAEAARKLFETGHRIARGAAMMANCEVEVDVQSGVWPVRCNQSVAETIQRNIEWVGMPEWSDEEQAFARALQKEIKKPEAGLNTEITPLRGPSPQVLGGNDSGDISWKVPMGRVYFPGNVPHSQIHHWSAGSALTTSIAHKGLVVGSIVTALTALDYLIDPALLARTKAQFKAEVGDVVYQPLIPKDQTPPVDLNAELMDRFRPSMERFYLKEKPVFAA